MNKPFIVLFRPPFVEAIEPPFFYVTTAKNGREAKSKCSCFSPDSEILWAWQGESIREALYTYWG